MVRSKLPWPTSDLADGGLLLPRRLSCSPLIPLATKRLVSCFPGGSDTGQPQLLVFVIHPAALTRIPVNLARKRNEHIITEEIHAPHAMGTVSNSVQGRNSGTARSERGLFYMSKLICIKLARESPSPHFIRSRGSPCLTRSSALAARQCHRGSHVIVAAVPSWIAEGHRWLSYT